MKEVRVALHKLIKMDRFTRHVFKNGTNDAGRIFLLFGVISKGERIIYEDQSTRELVLKYE